MIPQVRERDKARRYKERLPPLLPQIMDLGEAGWGPLCGGSHHDRFCPKAIEMRFSYFSS